MTFLAMNLFSRLTLLGAAALTLSAAPATYAQQAETKTKDKAAKPSKNDQLVTLHLTQNGTDLGDIRLILFDEAPLHKENFLKRAKNGDYNGTTFHRVIPGFMIQGGDPNSKDSDPNNDGQGPAGEATIPAEIRPEFGHKRGAVAAARQGDFVNPQRASSGSQFYIVQNPGGTPHLNGQYTVFGQVIQGQELVDKIAQMPRNANDRPEQDVKMTAKVERLKKKKITKEYGYQY